MIVLRLTILAALVLGQKGDSTIHAQNSGKSFEEIVRFAAPEAVQGVAVDERYFYAIANRAIGKYDKKTGQRVKKWEDAAGGPFIHLDSGVVIDRLLYCAHSNSPEIPMASSIEIFDTVTLNHVGSHSFGIFGDSATWINRWDGYW